MRIYIHKEKKVKFECFLQWNVFKAVAPFGWERFTLHSVLFSDQLIYLAIAENSLKLITAHSPSHIIFIVFIFAFLGLITVRRTYYSKHVRSQFTVSKSSSAWSYTSAFQIFCIIWPAISHPKANIYCRTENVSNISVYSGVYLVANFAAANTQALFPLGGSNDVRCSP